MTNINQKFIEGRRILVAITGSIAAVKAPMLVSSLVQAGAIVRCVTTKSASQLVSPLALSTLSRNSCYQDQDQWEASQSRPLHIELAEWAELVVVAPLSATSLSKLAYGNAEGLLSSILLATESTIIVAAAMNTGMWANKAVKRNWDYIKTQPNIVALEPSKGLLACDRVGEGRISSLELIELAIESVFIFKSRKNILKKDLKGLRILVTAGPTIEDLDPARYISNRSSGKMGMLIAQAAKVRGAEVDLIHGPIHMSKNWLEGLNLFPIRTAKEMQTKISSLQSQANIIFMTAAIGDFRKSDGMSNKKNSKDTLFKSLAYKLEQTPDLLKEIVARKKTNQLVMGFSALTGTDEEVQSKGELKRLSKGCEMLFANPIDRPDQGFEENSNGGFLLSPNKKAQMIKTTTKLCLAHQLLDAIYDYRCEFFKKL